MSAKFDPHLCEQLENLCLGGSEGPWPEGWRAAIANQLAAARRELSSKVTQSSAAETSRDKDTNQLSKEITSLHNLCNEYHRAKEPLEKVFEAALAYVRAIETPTAKPLIKVQTFADLKRMLDLAMR